MVDANLADASGSLQTLLGALGPINTRGNTVTRMIIDLMMVPTVTNAVTGMQKLSIGIGIASQDAFGVGASALPNPATEADEPARGWLYRGHKLINDDTAQFSIAVVSVDIRAKRKVDNGELYLLMENFTTGGTAFSVTVVGLIRTLMLLP